jgi:medium-chain acyl-[acyl-carrier-protein] hydrolase
VDVMTETRTSPRPVLPGPRSEPDSGWTTRWQPEPDAALRLFCLPHTGGGAAVYRLWASLLAPQIEVVAIRLPGRECRYAQEPHSRIETLIPALLNDLEPELQRPYAWFGHSMGALVAFEACREGRRRGLPGPSHLFVSGRRAPHLPARDRPVHAAPREELVAHLRTLGGTPPQVLEDRASLSFLLPMLRADFAVSETYVHRPDRPLDCPVSVFGAAADPVTSAAELVAWRVHTSRQWSVRMFPGDHFFLHGPARAQVLAALRQDLADGPAGITGRLAPLGRQA